MEEQFYLVRPWFVRKIRSRIQPDTWLARILSCRPLRWIGRVSYGAYVFHVIPKRFFAGVAEHLTPQLSRVGDVGVGAGWHVRVGVAELPVL